jgi:hypothetical protein
MNPGSIHLQTKHIKVFIRNQNITLWLQIFLNTRVEVRLIM